MIIITLSINNQDYHQWRIHRSGLLICATNIVYLDCVVFVLLSTLDAQFKSKIEGADHWFRSKDLLPRYFCLGINSPDHKNLKIYKFGPFIYLFLIW